MIKVLKLDDGYHTPSYELENGDSFQEDDFFEMLMKPHTEEFEMETIRLDDMEEDTPEFAIYDRFPQATTFKRDFIFLYQLAKEN